MCDNKLFWFWLSRCEWLGLKRLGRLLEVFGSPERIFCADREKINAVIQMGDKYIDKMMDDKNFDKLTAEYTNMKQNGIYFITNEEKEFPEKLREIPEEPYFLYYKGHLPDSTVPSIAVIGSRCCSYYGKEMALYFSETLARSGIQIISGLAAGVDGYAHRGAIKAEGSTYGVLGCGVDICYPQENIGLYMDMLGYGGVLSEYAPGRKPMAYNFPMRNRLISALSDGILVIEARAKSGTLITVDRGLEQGKDVFAVPGRVGDVLSGGCNCLIKNGAKLVTEPYEIAEELFLRYPKYAANQIKEKKKNNYLLAREEKIVYAILSLEPKHIETMLKDTGMSPERLMGILVALEMKGCIREVERNHYIRNEEHDVKISSNSRVAGESQDNQKISRSKL